jgi:S-adenosylmethionine hydrolase
LARVVYIDGYGNAMVGIRAKTLARNAVLEAQGRVIRRHRTFADVPAGESLWYTNGNGLAEIAVNQGRASELLNLTVGSPVEITTAG